MSSGVTRKYAPDDVAIVVGVMAVTGLHEGSFVEVDRSVDVAQLEIGSDGEATMTISPNQSGSMKITLQQSSPLNDYFTTLFIALQQKNTAVGVVPFTLNDKNGSTICSAKQSFTQKPTKVTFADKPEGREWTFLTGYLSHAPGGENSV
jgi:hypothetical protein